MVFIIDLDEKAEEVIYVTLRPDIMLNITGVFVKLVLVPLTYAVKVLIYAYVIPLLAAIVCINII